MEAIILGLLGVAKGLMDRAQQVGQLSAEGRARIEASALSIFGRFEHAAPPPPPAEVTAQAAGAAAAMGNLADEIDRANEAATRAAGGAAR